MAVDLKERCMFDPSPISRSKRAFLVISDLNVTPSTVMATVYPSR